MPIVTDQGFELHGSATSLRSMLRSLWASRDLLTMLARKAFTVRYRRASIGMLWAVAMPLIQASVLAVIFSQIIQLDVDGRNRALFIYSGVLPWSFFSSTVGASASAIIDGKDISTRVYFPRAIFPLVVVRANFYGFLPGIVVLLVMTPVLGVPLGPEVFLLLPGVLLLVMLAAGFALVFAALNVYFRDVRHIVAALLIPWFYASGVFFPLSLAPSGLRSLLSVNPMVGMIQLFRAATIGPDEGWEPALWSTAGWCVALFVVAALLYRRFDRVFADLL